MSWLQHLYETYEMCYGREPDGSTKLLPIAHTTQQAHIEVVLDGQGRFRRASTLAKEDATTLIPCTESSGGRSGSKPTCHPLCDKLQYLASDYLEFGGEVTSGFAKDPSEPHRIFMNSLSSWCFSEHGHAKLNAVLHYVKRGNVIADLVSYKILPVESGKLIKTWDGDKNQEPAIYKSLPPGQLPQDAFVRWRVEDNEVASGTWEDSALINSWIAHYAEIQTSRGFCMVQGVETTLATQHPAKLRHAADKAKLISANDDSGFTFRGRFFGADEAVGVGFEVTQKAHNALRWLLQRQGSRNGDQAIVSWTKTGVDVPDLMADSFGLLSNLNESPSDATAGQAFALQLKRAINGYKATLVPTEMIYVIALDSATPGRMSITYYRELHSSEFLQRIEDWHMAFSWPQSIGRELRFVGAPAPRDIAQAAYGRRLDTKVENATRERLLPSIVDRLPVPGDLRTATFRRVINRVSLDPLDWEKYLGIACAMFKGTYTERNYQMALELDRTSRDYLYGRLLALAENLENHALYVASENRETTAARLMQRFADRPFSTWRNIELALAPYKMRLRNIRPAVLARRLQEIDSIHAAFAGEDFMSDLPLTGEFLLGYHCQRAALRMQRTESEKNEAAFEQNH